MHIVVCVKQVPDTAEVRIDPERGTLVREGVESILNPLDAHAVEAAVCLRERLGGLVTALSMGPPQAEAALREAVARGCDRAILLTDRAFSGADTWATSYTLARAIEKLADADLVLCGKQAIDGDTAQVGPGIAAHLGRPQAAYVRRITQAGAFLAEDASQAPELAAASIAPANASTARTLPAGPAALAVECLTDYGIETLRVPLPAVLTVLKDLNVPRLPSLESQMRARRCAVERWGPGDIGGEAVQLGLAGSPTRVVRVFTPPARGKCVIWEGPAETSAAALANVLKREGFV